MRLADQAVVSWPFSFKSNYLYLSSHMLVSDIKTSSDVLVLLSTFTTQWVKVEKIVKVVELESQTTDEH